MWDVILDTLMDSARLIPFLFVTYLAMEYLEHKTAGKVKSLVQKGGRLGPLFGGVLGAVPQCGFSAAAAKPISRSTARQRPPPLWTATSCLPPSLPPAATP